MTHDRFKELLEELDGNSVSTLAEKNARYSSGNDALHNFIKGGDAIQLSHPLLSLSSPALNLSQHQGLFQ